MFFSFAGTPWQCSKETRRKTTILGGPAKDAETNQFWTSPSFGRDDLVNSEQSNARHVQSVSGPKHPIKLTHNHPTGTIERSAVGEKHPRCSSFDSQLRPNSFLRRKNSNTCPTASTLALVALG